MSSVRSRLILSLLFLLFAGCSHDVAPQVLYSAVIESIEDLPGQHFSPAKGQVPLSCLHLHLLRPMEENQPAGLQVLVLGLFRPDLYGRTGDHVSFHFAGRLPLSGKLWVEQLSGYRVQRSR